jgi:acyl-CoA thioesterase-1
MKQGTSRDAIPVANVSPSTSTVANTPRAAKRPTVLFIGTSLTAGYGLPSNQAYPSVIEHLADSAGVPIHAVNAGVSGETSSGALHRIEWVLRTPADIVLIETGANDGLRGLPVAAAKSNIETIVDKVKAAKPGAPILLVQMEAPPNLGQTYFLAFHDMYGEIAKAKGVTLVPFLLDSVAGRSALNQGDGVHPNATGAKIVAQNIWRSLEPVVRAIYAAG